uniref:BTB domain-containing protein n=1 Tax=Caenorhabditis tropicalis TaxID=1561998 RepID=A0A1I7V564_9PELO
MFVQLLTFHSPYFNSDKAIEIKDDPTNVFDDFLQIAHGVRGTILLYRALELLKFAKTYNLSHVIQLVDQKTKLECWRIEIFIPDAIEYGLDHWMAYFLREQGTSEELAGNLKGKNVERMSGEMMKKCVKRFFEFVIPNKHFVC